MYRSPVPWGCPRIGLGYEPPDGAPFPCGVLGFAAWTAVAHGAKLACTACFARALIFTKEAGSIAPWPTLTAGTALKASMESCRDWERIPER